jgi:molecular chaperone GrpE
VTKHPKPPMADGDDDTRTDPSAADPPAGEDAQARVRALEEELAGAKSEAQQNHERWLRERADLDNLKKRAARERADTVKYANEQVLRNILPVIDNLERAVEHAQGGGNGQPLVEGVALVLKELRAVLEKHGVTRIETKGAAFDPAHHEAMAQVESAEHEPNAVVTEHQAGYRLNERLLRPALVTVAKARDDLAKEKSRG